MPFFQLETALQGKSHSSIQKKPQQNTDDSLVRKVKKIVIMVLKIIKQLELTVFTLANVGFMEFKHFFKH